MTTDIDHSIEGRLHAALNEVAESVTCTQLSSLPRGEDTARQGRITGARAVVAASLVVVVAIGAAIAVTTATSPGSRHHRPESNIAPTSSNEPPSQYIASISIDSIGLQADVGEGLGPTTLDLGPAHDPSSGLPGSGRTVVIVGHRTTHTRPFLRLNELGAGTAIALINQGGARFDYVVVASVVTDPANVAPTASRYDDDLVLVTNTPLYTARQRLLVIARPSAAAR